MSVQEPVENRPLPGYVLRERIGAGADAEVFRAERAGRPGSVVAVKRLRSRVDPEVVRALRQEADILLALDHPSLVRLLDVVVDGEGLALVLGYAAGGSLADRRRAGPLPPREVADIGARLGSALAVLHDAALVHGDIKPSNVLFDAEQQPLLADLGAARFHGDRGALVGTLDHLAPEVLAGQPPDARSDLYALGVTLRDAVCDPPRALAELLETAVDPDPAGRPATAALLAGRFDEVQRSLRADDLDAPDSQPDSAAGSAGGSDADGAARWSPPTQRFGPLPPPPAPPDTDDAGLRRALSVAAMVAVVLTPIVVVGWLAATAIGG